MTAKKQHISQKKNWNKKRKRQYKREEVKNNKRMKGKQHVLEAGTSKQKEISKRSI